MQIQTTTTAIANAVITKEPQPRRRLFAPGASPE